MLKAIAKDLLALCAGAVLILLVLYPWGVNAQTIPASLDIEWTLPTETDCIEPVPAPCMRLPLTDANALAGIEVFVAQASIADDTTAAPVAALGATAVTADYTATVPNGSTLYVRVRAYNVSGKRSKLSSEVTYQVQVTADPGVPTNVRVRFTLTP